MTTIAIIGAGITGVTTADALIERGYRVTVFDRHRYPGMETSFANGGQLSACNAEVWNSIPTVLKGMKWMLRRDAPLLMNPRPSWHKYSWLAEFVGHIPDYRDNTIATTRMAIEARARLLAIAQRENISFDLERRGILHIYHDKASFDDAVRVNDLLRAGGLDRFAVTLAEMRSIEPTLTGTYHGGFYTPSDAAGDIHKFTRGLAQACIRRGANFIQDAQITAVGSANGAPVVHWCSAASEEASDRQEQTFDAVIVCAGTATRHLAAALGDRINIYPVKGYSITVQLTSPESRQAAPHVSLLDESAKIVTSRLGADRLRIAGTAEFNGFNRDIRADRIKPLLDWTQRQFPHIETSQSVPWCGLRPMMPDMMPVVRRGQRSGIYYNTGHGHLGWTLSAATAEMIAAIVDEDVTSGVTVAPNLHAIPASRAGAMKMGVEA